MHDRIARREDAFLLVVDVQEPLMKVMSEPDRLLKNAGILIEAAKALGLPIFATEQYPERFGPTVEAVRSRWGGLAPSGKMTFSSCGCSGVMEAIRESGRHTAVVCGVEAHVCVNQTVHDLLDEGMTVHVPADAVASRTEMNWRLGLEKMRESGAVVTSTEMVAYELMGRAGTPEFKALLPLFR
jgi:nicotinamidase-related amidase